MTIMFLVMMQILNQQPYNIIWQESHVKIFFFIEIKKQQIEPNTIFQINLNKSSSSQHKDILKALKFIEFYNDLNYLITITYSHNQLTLIVKLLTLHLHSPNQNILLSSSPHWLCEWSNDHVIYVLKQYKRYWTQSFKSRLRIQFNTQHVNTCTRKARWLYFFNPYHLTWTKYNQ